MTDQAADLGGPAPAAEVRSPVWRMQPGARVTMQFVLAVAVAALVTLAIGRSLPTQLAVRTDIVGYPIHSNYNIELVISVYYLIVIVFPLLAFLLYVSLGKASQRLGWAAGSTARLTVLEQDSEAPAPTEHALLAGAARALVVGASFGFEVAIARKATMGSFWLTVGFVTLIYAGVVIALGFLLQMTTFRNRRPVVITASINAFAAPLALSGLLAVSDVTGVSVAGDHALHGYSWLPIWLAVAMTAVVVLWVTIRVVRATDLAVAGVERAAVLFVSVPVLVFVVVSALPGALGPFNTFEDGQVLAGAQLMLDGYIPWRDALPVHGLLQDQLSSIPGFLLFGNSLWGGIAGRALLLVPLAYVSLAVFAVYMFGRSWAAILAFVVVMLAGTLSAANPGGAITFPALLTTASDTRFMPWPLVLVLMKFALDRARWWTIALLGAVLVAWVVLVPESLFALAAVGIVFVLGDLYLRERGQRLTMAFRGTLYLIAGGAALGTVVAAYLLIEGALGDYFRFYLNFGPGHELTGGLPVDLRTWGRDPYFGFAAVSPVVAVLVAMWYLAASARRRGLGSLNWVMATAGILTLLYYPKFLERADWHVLQPYGVAVPLIGLLVFQLCRAAEGALSGLRLVTWSGHRAVAQPITFLLLVAALFGTGSVMLDRLPLLPAQVRAQAPQEPQLGRLGYSTAPGDIASYADIDTVIRAYLGPGDWVFDFSNDPGLYYYLLGFRPRTKYYHVSLAVTEAAQQDLISQLKRDRPKLVVFTADRFGLASWDGIPNMVRHYDVSQYILDNYRPLLSIRGQVLYADATAGLSAALAQHLHLGELPITDNLPFRGQPCDWGTAPNFLSVSPPSRGRELSPVSLALRPSPTATALVSGWAVSTSVAVAPREVVVVMGDRVVGRGVVELERPDVAAARHDPTALRSGYQIAVPGGLPLEQLRVFGISGAGVASELSYGSPAAAHLDTAGAALQGLDLGNGTVVPVRPGAVDGFVDGATAKYVVPMSLPPNTTWADYRWLEIEAGPGGLHSDAWALSDSLVGGPSREVTFESLAGSYRTLKVYVGSCSQWHGYADAPLYVMHEQPQQIAAIRMLP